MEVCAETFTPPNTPVVCEEMIVPIPWFAPVVAEVQKSSRPLTDRGHEHGRIERSGIGRPSGT